MVLNHACGFHELDILPSSENSSPCFLKCTGTSIYVIIVIILLLSGVGNVHNTEPCMGVSLFQLVSIKTVARVYNDTLILEVLLPVN